MSEARDLLVSRNHRVKSRSLLSDLNSKIRCTDTDRGGDGEWKQSFQCLDDELASHRHILHHAVEITPRGTTPLFEAA
jgi:hypothetical protein